MAALDPDARARTEDSIRAAMDRLLSGDIPPGGRCDIKTLAAAAGVTRTGFYPKGGKPGPWQHLASEFHRRLAHPAVISLISRPPNETRPATPSMPPQANWAYQVIAGQ